MSVLHEEGFVSFSGLSDEEVKERVSKNLVNSINRSKTGFHYLQIIIENAFTLFNVINFTIILFLFYFYFTKQDDRLLLDSVGILIVIGLNTTFAIYQKIKSVKAIEKVELLKNRKVNVIRNSKILEIDLSSIVLNDILIIRKGDQIPVDSKIIKSIKFEVDESLITGESLSIPKKDNDDLLSGSFCINGMAYIEATKVGYDSYSNQITSLARKYKLTTSPLMNRINLIFTISFIVTLILIVIQAMIINDSVEFQIESIRKISTIAFTLIPEGLIFFTTFTIFIGIYKISKIGAIIQKLNAIDSFSTINVICLDKTGTITKNKITINKIINISNSFESAEINRMLGNYYHFSTNKNATIEVFSPFDSDSNTVYLDEIPFDSELKYSAILINNNKKNDLFVLGSLEKISEALDLEHKAKISNVFNQEELFGFRNLIFCNINDYEFREIQADFFFHSRLKPICIISLKDEVRDDVVQTLTEFKNMGKEIRILTGDTVDATYSVLREVGINISYNGICEGRNLINLSKSELLNVIQEYKYFAALTPSQKLNLVKILKQSHKQICFIGDGLNDLPAIKEADLGIAMESGLTITKEVSDIVLLKNKFSLLPEIFREGNRIINSVFFITTLYLVKNFTVFLMVLMNWMFQLPFPLTPRRSSLLSALAIGLPSYFISIKNKKIVQIKDYWKELLLVVIPPSITLIIMIYSSLFISRFGLTLSSAEIEYVMFSVLILCSIINFFCFVSFQDTQNRKKYLLFSFLMIILLIFFNSIELQFIPFSIFTDFYEIEIMSVKQWIISIIFTLLCALALLIIHLWISRKK